MFTNATSPVMRPAYRALLDELSKGKFAQLTPELQKNVLAFYSDPKAPETRTRMMPRLRSLSTS